MVVSDGHFVPDQRTKGQQRIDRLLAARCGVVWLALGDSVEPMNGTHLITLYDPAAAAATIGKAATHALRHT